MVRFTKEDLIQRLKQFDLEAYARYGDSQRFYVVIVGGGALLLTGMIPRMTHDIDAFKLSEELMGFMEKYDVNIRVSSHLLSFPDGVLERVQRLEEVQGLVIDFYTASLEDIVISKIHAWRDPDIADVTSPAVLKALDWDKLHTLSIEGEYMFALNDRLAREFKDRFDEYERRYRPR